MPMRSEISIEDLVSSQNMQSIVDSIGSLINHHVVICNREGVIIAATNRARLGIHNEDIARMLENKHDMLVVDYKTESKQGFLPGVNQSLWHKGAVVGSLGITGDPDEVKVFCKIVRSFVQQQLLELEEEKSRASRRQMLSGFIHSWIFTDQVLEDPDFALRAESFGIDLYAPRVICVIHNCTPAREDILPDRQIQNVLLFTERFMKQRDTAHVVSLLGQSVVVLLNTQDTAQAKILMSDLQAALHQIDADCAVGIGSAFYDVHQIKLSYESARLACNASVDTQTHEIFVFELFDLELIIATANHRHLQRVFNYVFRNYHDSASIDESVGLLREYIQSNRSVDQTAQSMNLHKNTVQYRLNKIYELTGYNPRNARDLTFLHTVALIYKLGIRKTSQNI